MGKKYLMALDAGGGSGRCLLLDVATGETVTATRSWSHPHAPDTAGLGYDMDLALIWSRLGNASRELMKRAEAGPGDVLGVSVTSMRNTTVVLADGGSALFTASNQDARALVEALGLGASMGKEIHACGGHWPSPLFSGTRLLWLKNNAPSALEKAAAVCSLSDWLSYRLSGRIFAEKTQSAETLLFDLETDDWSLGLIEDLGLPAVIFPPVIDAGSVIGPLIPEAASHLGLPSGTPVIAGGADTQCGLLGAGACEAADLGIVAGTTMPVQMVTDGPVKDLDGRLWTGRHLAGGRYVLESNGLTTGSVLDWFAGMFYREYREPLKVLLAEASGSIPGAAGVYSTLGVHVFDGRVISVPMGSLSLSHMVTPGAPDGRKHVARSLLEGIAYSALANASQTMEASGTLPGRIFVTGGMSRSTLWTEILCNVFSRNVFVTASSEASSIGAAICAGAGAGVYPDLVTGSRERFEKAVELSPGTAAAKYQILYTGWRESVALQEPADNHLAGLMTMSMVERSQAEGPTADAAFRPPILVTASLDDASLEELRDLGEVTYSPWREARTVYDGGEALVEALRGFDVFITEMDIVDFDAIRSLPGLKALVSCRVNPVNIDVDAATAFGVPVINTPGRNAGAVADFTLACMLMLARNLQEASGFLKVPGGKAGDMSRMAEAYLKFQGKELWRKTVGIIGLGEVGGRVAERCSCCGADVLFYDPGVTEESGALANARKVALDTLLAACDFVSVHAPATEATEGMMGMEQFAAMKKGAFFLNMARASLVESAALASSLASGHLAGAALDVFDDEPPASDDPLVSRPDVIATPHLGGNTLEVAAHQGAIAAEQLRKLLRGESPDYLVNPAVLGVFGWTTPRPEPGPEELRRLAENPRPTMTS